ncbi:hypothetical protein PENTCL1PPCAC_29568, partial [Pristionchus entomophagus]
REREREREFSIDGLGSVVDPLAQIRNGPHFGPVLLDLRPVSDVMRVVLLESGNVLGQKEISVGHGVSDEESALARQEQLGHLGEEFVSGRAHFLDEESVLIVVGESEKRQEEGADVGEEVGVLIGDRINDCLLVVGLASETESAREETGDGDRLSDFLSVDLENGKSVEGHVWKRFDDTEPVIEFDSHVLEGFPCQGEQLTGYLSSSAEVEVDQSVLHHRLEKI